MRRIILLLTYIGAVLSTFAQDASHSGDIGANEALKLVSEQFDLNQVNVYLDNNSYSSDSWTFFIDEHPNKGWAHECCLYEIPKSSSAKMTFKKTDLRFFPRGDFKLVSAMPRPKTEETINPAMIKIPALQEAVANPDANRTYAIILSGGIDPKSNPVRYWNDCSFIYKVLRNRYGIPKENIVPIMADGDDPAPDYYVMRRPLIYDADPEQVFLSQNLDLDGDGVNDIEYAATKENIQNTLNKFLSRIKQNDQLFFYVMDHGDTVKGKANICLWKNERVYNDELAAILKPFTDKGVIVNAILGQCYAGGFVDNLSEIGCVVTTACSAEEESYGSSSIYYDEFVYWWTTSINGMTPTGTYVNADANNDGFVSMQEAFEFAKANDEYANESDGGKISEHPQYSSNPAILGQTLAINRIPKALELFIKDNPADVGQESNLTSEIWWDSPDIWIRNVDDGKSMHENPNISADNSNATIYVKIRNNGWKDYHNFGQGSDTKYLHLYWTKSSTSMAKKTWMGKEQYDGYTIGGTVVPPIPIPSIPAGGDTIVKINWSLNSVSQNIEDNHFFALFAKVLDSSEPELYTYRGTRFMPANYKTQAQKNLSIINITDNNIGVSSFVRNPNETSAKKYSLEIIERYDPTLYGSGRIFSTADVLLTLDESLYSDWVNGGCSSVGVINPGTRGPKTFLFSSNNQKISDILLSGEEIGKVKLQLSLKGTTISDGKTYVFDLIQRDETGNIVGGQTFSYTEPSKVIIPIYPELYNSPVSGSNVLLRASAPEGYTNLTWKNSKGEFLGSESVLPVNIDTSDSLVLASAMNEDGETAYGSIDVSNLQLIKNAYLTNNGTTLHIDLLTVFNNDTDQLVLSCTSNPAIPTYTVETVNQLKSIEFDMTNYPAGIYAITLYRGRGKVDSVKFNKK